MLQLPSRLNFIRILAMFAPAIFAIGCGEKSGVDLQPVTGTVRMDGKPLNSAAVFFRPSGVTKGTGSFGKTDADGKYELATDRDGAGAVEGTYDVFISREVDAAGAPVVDVAEDPNAPAQVDGGIRESVPAAYSNYQKPTLTATVAAGGSTVDFDLKSKP